MAQGGGGMPGMGFLQMAMNGSGDRDSGGGGGGSSGGNVSGSGMDAVIDAGPFGSHSVGSLFDKAEAKGGNDPRMSFIRNLFESGMLGGSGIGAGNGSAAPPPGTPTGSKVLPGFGGRSLDLFG